MGSSTSLIHWALVATNPDDQPEGSGEQYPLPCPSCEQRAGSAKTASTVKGNTEIVRLQMQCAACGHGWTIDKLIEKPD
jgi:hypothetical protein